MAEKRKHDLTDFLEQTSADIEAEYRRIFRQAAQDPGTAGDEGEENWASLLRRWLPPAYHVATKGQLIGHDGALSPQVDVVVLKPSYPPLLREKRKWLAAGVAAAFECKLSLKADHISSLFERSRRFKSLYPKRIGSPYSELRSPLVYGLLSHSHSWKSDQSKILDKIECIIRESCYSVEHPRNLPDLLCVADLSAWSLMQFTYYSAEWSEQKDVLEKAFGGPWGPMTCYTSEHDRPQTEPRSLPVGGLITSLWGKLAWSDPSMRDLVAYFQSAGGGGGGGGSMYPWPASSYSRRVIEGISNGKCVNGPQWNEWSVALQH